MSTFWRIASSRSTSRVVFPLTIAAITVYNSARHRNKELGNETAGIHLIQKDCQDFTHHLTHCDAATSSPPPRRSSAGATNTTYDHHLKTNSSTNDGTGSSMVGGGMMRPDMAGDYHGLFPLRQLFIPNVEYPLWDNNWDDRQPEFTGNVDDDRRVHRQIRKNGVTRHIILVRHGQYDETYKEDDKRILTPLGREQAHMTGKRIAEMMKGAEASFGPCQIKSLRVSNLTRAKETATIIATHLPGVFVEGPDPMLNEGRPCHTIPGGPMSEKDIELTDAHHPRIEGAFRKYIYRSTMIPEIGENMNGNATQQHHEFEIIVCHANVIRYVMCRALQLPPEAWLRFCPFNCSLTYLTIRPTGTVSCRMLGDIGHLPYNATTFSGHHGYNW